MQQNYKFLLILISLIITPLYVNATALSPEYYWPYQTVNHVNEIVTLDKSNLYIQFEAEILINESVYNKSKWVSFYFSPTSFLKNSVKDYKDFVGIQTEDCNCNLYESNKNISYIRNDSKAPEYYDYYLDLTSLNGQNSIIFKSNFILENKLSKIGDYLYSLYYIHQIETHGFNGLIYKIPNNFEIKEVTIPGQKRYSAPYYIFEPEPNSINQPSYFYLENKFEKKKGELINNLIFLFFGAILGAIISLIFTICYNIYKEHSCLQSINLNSSKNKNAKLIIISGFCGAAMSHLFGLLLKDITNLISWTLFFFSIIITYILVTWLIKRI